MFWRRTKSSVMISKLSPRTKLLYYLILRFYERFRKPLYSRKKIQKLLFLVEHFDLERRAIVKSLGITGYTFYIWGYGPFSKEIYDDLEDLVEKKLIEENVVTLNQDIESELGIDLNMYSDDGAGKRMYIYTPEKNDTKFLDLDPKVSLKIDIILSEFGMKRPHELEEIVNEMLKLDNKKKIRCWGISIDEYIEKGFSC